MVKAAQSAFNIDQHEIISEEGDVIAWEIKNRKKNVTDSKPIHFSNAILQTSKLLFLEFMYWLYRHLEPGSFRTCYADTDRTVETLYSDPICDPFVIAFIVLQYVPCTDQKRPFSNEW